MSDRVDIVEIIPVKKGNPTVVTGFTGPGFIGNTALMYLVRQKGYEQKVQLKSQLIPPMILLIQGVPTHVFRIYANNDDSVLFVLSEALIGPEYSWSIGLKLMKWLIDKGVKEIISIEGMPFGAFGDSRPIFGYSNPQRSLTSYGIQSTSEGGISGINAVMLEESLKNRISWVSLFVPTDQAQTIDYGGSAAIIEVLNKMFKLGVDPEVLKKSDDIRRQMMQRSRNAKQKSGFFDSLRRRRNNSGIASY
jgi:predicted ATP-grasp superfamily ATP-dependent carboligase